jgi:hypothetical protein
VKDNKAKPAEDYVTTYTLNAWEKEYIYSLLMALNVESYPDFYEPTGISMPYETIILTVCIGDVEKTINAGYVAAGYNNYKDEAAKAFLEVCDSISYILETTDEWNALPFYFHGWE